MPVIVSSNRDLASVNIRQQLIKSFAFKRKSDESTFDGNPVYVSEGIPLITSEKELVDSEHIEQFLKTDLIIFASRHKSVAGKPGLLVHCTGNWTSEAELGGKPYELAIAPASALREAVRDLARQRDELGLTDYEVTLECTHHGPTGLSSPLLFVELGSDEKCWKDEVAGVAVAKTIYKVAKGFGRYKAALGIGGPHYSPNFTRVVFSSSKIALGHIIPSYVLVDLRREMIRNAIERTLEKVELILLDWKGLRADHREFIRSITQELDIETIKTHEVTRSTQ